MTEIPNYNLKNNQINKRKNPKSLFFGHWNQKIFKKIAKMNNKKVFSSDNSN